MILCNVTSPDLVLVKQSEVVELKDSEAVARVGKRVSIEQCVSCLWNARDDEDKMSLRLGEHRVWYLNRRLLNKWYSVIELSRWREAGWVSSVSSLRVGLL
jgi:hypothetical protein